jgi:hypothetical protein
LSKRSSNPDRSTFGGDFSIASFTVLDRFLSKEQDSVFSMRDVSLAVDLCTPGLGKGTAYHHGHGQVFSILST